MEKSLWNKCKYYQVSEQVVYFDVVLRVYILPAGEGVIEKGRGGWREDTTANYGYY